MIENELLWKAQVFAERARGLARTIAMEAARLDSEAYAVVASETLKIAQALIDEVEKARFGDSAQAGLASTMSSQAVKLEMLAINSGIVALQPGGDRGIAICADEVQGLAAQLSEALGAAGSSPIAILPEAARPSAASRAEEYFICLSVGGARLTENLRFVREIMRYDPVALAFREGSMELRGRRIPLLDAYAALGRAPPAEEGSRRILVLKADWERPEGREFGVAVDPIAINAIFRSRLGRAVPPASRDIPAPLLREAWDAADGSQFLFLDWPALSRAEA
jgi:chemotaxis signal transduction protein